MEEIIINCKVRNYVHLLSKYVKTDSYKTLKSNMMKLLNYIPDYDINDEYKVGNKTIERVIIIKFPYSKFIENLSSKEKYFDLNVPVIIQNKERTYENYESLAYDCFNKFLHDLFLILNIVGCNDFQILGWEYPYNDNFKIPSLHSSYFEVSKHLLIKEFNFHNQFDIIKVVDFIKDTYSRHDALPFTSIHKALNVLLHLSIEPFENFIPANGLLITYALESILGGGIPKSLLVKRICLVLNMKQNQKIKKTLNDIYDWRNTIVHGEYQIPHPTLYETTEHYDKIFSEYISFVNKGFTLLFALVQMLIKNNAKDINFSEDYSYI